MTIRIGKDHSGEELGAEKKWSDGHDTPAITILQAIIPKRNREGGNVCHRGSQRGWGGSISTGGKLGPLCGENGYW